MQPDPIENLPEPDALEVFLAALAAAQQRLTVSDASATDVSLVLAVSLLRYRRIAGAMPSSPLQVVVAGPTQAGKSTAVNWLFGRAVAEASPLAGFTRHAQGFACPAPDAGTVAGLTAFFADSLRLPCADLHDAAESAWCLDTLPADGAAFDRPVLLWDSPDFDSINSRYYRAGAFRLFALADAVVLMVSKEKYADRTVWSALELLEPLNLPTLICINKVPDEARDALTASLQDRLASAGVTARVLSLPHVTEVRPGDMPALRDALAQVLAEARPRPAHRPVEPYLARHWDAWCGGARAEYRQADVWRERVGEAIAAACRGYEEQYLRAPHYAGTMQQAMVRLLELLEVPGLAQPLVKARQMLMWPARRLRRLFAESTGRPAKMSLPDRERVILQGIVRKALSDLEQQAAHLSGLETEPGAAWWKNLFTSLFERNAEFDDRALASIDAYQAAFATEVEAAAQVLFNHLRQHPARLNSLRAARVTTDAAGLLIALKTGGVGLNDLVLMPAMLSFTTMLTEGAVGGYMLTVEKRLKTAQREAVCAGLFETALQQILLDAPQAMSKQGLWDVDEGLYQAAEEALRQ